MQHTSPNSLSYIALIALMSICAVAIVALALNRSLKIEGDPTGKVVIEAVDGPADR